MPYSPTPPPKRERPAACTDAHLKYLDGLREEGAVNMMGARPHLMAEFPELSRDEAREIMLYWMESFSERHPPNKAGA